MYKGPIRIWGPQQLGSWGIYAILSQGEEGRDLALQGGKKQLFARWEVRMFGNKYSMQTQWDREELDLQLSRAHPLLTTPSPYSV